MVDIIGLVGFIGSGKGTVSDIAVDYGFIKESFAKGVKDATAAMFGWSRLMLEGDTYESRLYRETPCPFWSEKMGREFTPREALQKMGTEVGRDIFHEDFWVLQTEQRIKSYDKNVVIADVRFPNEIDWIHNMGGIVIEVRRGELPDWYETLKITDPKDSFTRNSIMKSHQVHYSEWAWIGCKTDGTIINDGTLEDLTELCKNVILRRVED